VRNLSAAGSAGVARACAVVCVGIVLAATPSAQREKAVAIADLLETYARGDFAAAISAGAGLPDLASWKEAYPTASRAWIDRASSSTDVPRRRLVAAGLILEVTRERYERDAAIWTALRPAVEWACEALRREPAPSRGEQAWQRASVAFGQRVQDSAWLAMGPLGGHHLEHAWQRFPSDPRLALASVAMGTRPVDRDIEQRTNAGANTRRATITPSLSSFGGATGIVPGAESGITVMTPNGDVPDPRQESRQAISAFARLLGDPEVGGEAHAHVSHLYLTLHEWQPALEHAKASTEVARDGQSRYLGFVMAGLALEQLGRANEAAASYRRALDALPRGQTAALLLAALDDSVDAPGSTASLVGRSLAASSGEDDPWRLYYYGDYFRWSEYIAQLHDALR